MKDDDLMDLLMQKLRWLRLPGMAKLAPSLFELAAKDNLSSLEVVHRLCDEEKQSRLRAAVERRVPTPERRRTRAHTPRASPGGGRTEQRTAPASAGGSLGTGDSGETGTLARRR